MHEQTTETPSSARKRLPVIDGLRGLALLAMAVYHFSWDLAYHGLVDWNVAHDPLWRGFAVAIATSFLALSGVGLVLAARGGLNMPAFTVRLLKIGGAALLISVATRFLFPDTWIYFGVLHMIALGSLLALPVLRLPVAAILALAALVLVLPFMLEPGIFHTPWLAFTGLSSEVPASNDFVPVFPWFAAILVGVAAGRLIEAGRIGLSSAPATGPMRALATLGRWSLPFYLVHQPVLFGLVAAAVPLAPVNPATERANFVRDCATACGREPSACATYCNCIADALEGTPFWSVRGGDPDLSPLVSTAANVCRIREIPPR